MKKHLLFLLALLLGTVVQAQVNSFPWTEDFENGLGQWKAVDYDGDGYGWYADSAARSNSWENTGALEPDNWLISPALTLDDGLELTWYVAAGCSSPYNADHYTVYIGTDTVVDNFTDAVYSETLSTTIFSKRTVDLSAYAGQTVYIAFRHHDCTDMCSVVIDNIMVSGAAPAVDCSVALTALNETFTLEPQCWTLLDEDGDGSGWYLAGGYIQSDSYNGGALTPDNWLITPKVQLPSGDCYLSYRMKTSGGTFGYDKYGIYISTTGNDPDDFTLLFSETGEAYGSWTELGIDLSDYAGQTVYLAFRHYDCTDMYYIRLDDVQVQSGTYNSAPKYTLSVEGNGGYYSGYVNSNYFYSNNSNPYEAELVEGTSGSLSIYTFNPSYTGWYTSYFDDDHMELVGLTVNGEEIDLDALEYSDYMGSSGYKIYYYYFDVYEDLEIELTYGPYTGEPIAEATVTHSGNGGYYYGSVGGNYFYSYDDTTNNVLSTYVGKTGFISLYSFSPAYSGYMSSYFDEDHMELVSFVVDGVEVPLDSLTFTDYMASSGYKYCYYDFVMDGDHTFEVTYGPYTGEPIEEATVTISSNGGCYYYNLGGNYGYTDNGNVTIATYVGTTGYTSFYSFTPDYTGNMSSYYDADHMVLEGITVNGVAMALDSLDYYSYDNYSYYSLNFTVEGDMDIVATYGPYGNNTPDTSVVQPDGTFQYWDFASDHMTGINAGSGCRVKTGDIINGEAVSSDEAHNSSTPVSFWQRIPDSAYVVDGSFYDTYPYAYNYGAGAYLSYYMGASQAGSDNGFMFISGVDNGVSNYSSMNAYVEFPEVTVPDDVSIIEVKWRQVYRKYYDQCFIDYRINGQWYSKEVNVTGEDVSVNSYAPITMSALLPLEAAEQSTIKLRFRYYGPANKATAGYFWAIDDVTMAAGPEMSLTLRNDEYAEGGYSMIPQGFELPLTWRGQVKNTGAEALTNVKTTVYHTSPGYVEAVETIDQDDLVADAGETHYVSIDARNFINESGTAAQWFYSEQYGNDEYDPTNSALLPTTLAGLQQIYVAVSADQNIYEEFPTHTYMVTEDDEDGNVPGYRWAHDNGVLAGSGFRYGWTSDGYITDWSDNFNNAGYRVLNRFTTGATIPTDENGYNWVMRGVELVADPALGDNVAGARIVPVLWRLTTEGTFEQVATGVVEYTVKASDLNNFYDIDVNGNPVGYKLNGEYNTISILFPEQPELEPNTSYYVGYELLEWGNFAVAASRNYYFNEDGSTSRFFNNDELVDYANMGFAPHDYSVQVYDNSGNNAIWGFNIGVYPMIRAIVGPQLEIPHYEIYVECNDDVTVINSLDNNAAPCGEPIEVAESSTIDLYVYANEFRKITAIYVDGEEQDLEPAGTYNLPVFNETDGTYLYTRMPEYYIVRLENVDENHEVSFSTESYCPTITIENVAYGSDYASVAWNYGVEGPVTVYINGVADSITTYYSGSYNLWNMVPGVSYTLTLERQCPDGSVNTASTVLALPVLDTLVVTNTGGGIMFDNTNYTSMEAAGDYYFTGNTGDQKVIVAFDIPESYAMQNNPDLYESGAYHVKQILVDGVSLSLEGDDNLEMWGISNSNGELIEGGIAYLYTATIGQVSHVEVVFGVEEIDSTVCYNISNLYSDYDSQNAWVSWTKSPTLDGNQSIYLNGEYYGSTSTNWFDFYGLDEGTYYSVTIVTPCLNGDSVSYSFDFTTLTSASYTVTKVGNGAAYSGDYGMMYGSGSFTVEGYEGNSTYMEFASFSAEQCLNNGYDPSYGKVVSIALDGEEIALDGSDDRLVVEDYFDGNGYIFYELYFNFGEYNDITVTYSSVIDTTVCHAVSEGYVDWVGTTEASIYFKRSSSSNGNYLIQYTNENGPVSDTIYVASYFYFNLYDLAEGNTYEVTVTTQCANGNLADTTFYVTTYAPAHITVTKNQNGALYNPIYGGHLPVGTTVLDGNDGDQTYFTLYDFPTEAATQYGWNLKYRTPSEVLIDGEEVDINDYVYDTLYTDDGIPFTRYVIWAVFGEMSTLEVSYTGDEVPSYEYTLSSNGGYMRFIDYGSDNSYNFDDSLAVTVDSASTVYTLFYTYNPNHPDNGNVMYGQGHEVLTQVWLDGEEIAIDGSDNRIAINNQMDAYGYISYQLPQVVDGPHTIEGVFTEWTNPSQFDLTILNYDNGPVAYYDPYGESQEVFDSVTYFVDSSATVEIQMLSYNPANNIFNFDYNTYSSQRLTAVYLDGESIAIDGSDDRLQFEDYTGSNYGDIMMHVLTLNMDTPHTVETQFGPWDNVDVPQYTVTINNPDSGYVWYSDYQTRINGTETLTVDSGAVFSIDFADIDPTKYTNMVKSGSEMLASLTLDGENIAIDGSSDLITITDYYASVGYKLYTLEFTVTGDAEISATYNAFVPDTTDADWKVVNDGNGYMYNHNTNQRIYDDVYYTFGEVFDTVVIGLASFQPESEYYNFVDSSAAKLNAIYIDGESVAIDGTDSRVNVYNYPDEYYTYYNVTLSADGTKHTLVAEFGPFDTTYVEPTVYDITLINNGGGYFEAAGTIVWDTMIATADSGINAYVLFATVDPESSIGQSMGEVGLTGYTLTGIKFDGVSVAIDGTDPNVDIYDYLNVDTMGYKLYAFYFDVTGNHTIEGIFGPWSDDTIPETNYTFTYTNTGNGLMVRMDEDDDDFNFCIGTTTKSYAAGTEVAVQFFNVEDPENEEVKEVLDMAGITASQLEAIKLDGNNIPLVESDNLMIYSSDDEDDLPDGITAYILILSADANHTIEGVFNNGTPQQYFTLTVESSDEAMGTVEGSGTYAAGSTVSISATPMEGYKFVSWQDGNSDNPRSVVVNADITYTATFAPVDATVITITAVSADTTMGTVSGGGSYLEGETVVLTATPKPGYVFDSWQDGSTDNPLTFTATADANYTATFKPADGIDDVEFATRIEVYPNPTTTGVTIGGMPEGASLTFIDQSGRTVLTIDRVEGTTLHIDLSGYARGTYFIRVSHMGASATRKLLVR